MQSRFLGGDDAASAAARFRAVADDLDLLAGSGIGAIGLGQAPLLERWTYDLAPSAFLRGTVVGHPSMPLGPRRTSDLVAIDPEAGWARTWGRWYRLGAPSHAERRR